MWEWSQKASTELMMRFVVIKVSRHVSIHCVASGLLLQEKQKATGPD